MLLVHFQKPFFFVFCFFSFGNQIIIENMICLNSNVFFTGPWPPVNFRDRPLFKPIELDDMGEDGSDDSSHHQQEKKRRRLTADQVEFLEKSFESENKLEPAKKFQLAEVLGVEPRQIAIWFQNRRARWRTRQLEKDWEALRSSYDSLKADHEYLLKEKQRLEAKVIQIFL